MCAKPRRTFATRPVQFSQHHAYVSREDFDFVASCDQRGLWSVAHPLFGRTPWQPRFLGELPDGTPYGNPHENPSSPELAPSTESTRSSQNMLVTLKVCSTSLDLLIESGIDFQDIAETLDSLLSEMSSVESCFPQFPPRATVECAAKTANDEEELRGRRNIS